MPVDKAAPGVAVDSKGGAAVDPTANVISLNEAANRRQDDLRAGTEKYIEACLHHLKEMAELRADHAAEMRALESDRLDKIREVDVLARNTAADRAADAISALAATTATNAENIRNAMQSTAAAIAKQTSDTIGLITERLTSLERSSYEGKGKQAVADPMLAELVAEMKRLVIAQSQTTGKGQGMSALVGYVVVAFGLAATILAIAAFFTK